MPTAIGSASLSALPAVTLPQLAMVTGTAAVYTWDLLAQHETGPQTRLEGVPVPMSSGESGGPFDAISRCLPLLKSSQLPLFAGTSFTPTSVRYSPDGQKVILASAGAANEMGAHCVGVVVDEGDADEASMSLS